MIKTELFLCLLKQVLELRACQERDWDNVSTPVFTNIHHKMALWDVQREALFVVVLFLSQARAPLEDLFQHRCLRESV